MSDRYLKVTLIRSLYGGLARHRSCAFGLGLRRIRQTVVVPATPENLGMINRISHMLRVEEADAGTSSGGNRK